MLFSGAYILWPDPLVVSCGGFNELERILAFKRPATVLMSPAWDWTVRTLPRLSRLWLRARAHGKSLHLMRNTTAQDRLLRSLGFPGALVSINCYINEHVFEPQAVQKEYDAVYAAQMQPVKRIELAKDVKKLFVLTYGDFCTSDGDFDLHGFEPSVAHADFNRRFIGPAQIAAVYNRAKVGLSLSAREGAMLASVEYMLCGLPQVSTPCRGGRELFFDDQFVKVVEPSPAVIARAVAELIEQAIDPQLVRARTLERLTQHRKVLCSYVAALVERTTRERPNEAALYATLFGQAQGARASYVHMRDFQIRGFV